MGLVNFSNRFYSIKTSVKSLFFVSRRMTQTRLRRRAPEKIDYKPSNLRVLNTIDIQSMPTGSQPKHNSSKKDDDEQPRRVSSFTAAAMEDHKKERSSSILDGWWSLC